MMSEEQVVAAVEEAVLDTDIELEEEEVHMSCIHMPALKSA